MRNNLFDVDHEGLRKILGDKPKGRLFLELIQNCLDENVKTVTLEIAPDPERRGFVKVRVEDDGPEGFRDLTHAYTLFAESYKAGDPEKIGCYNLGEKLVIALCRRVTISSTKGTVLFDVERGERQTTRARREIGTIFEADMKMNRQEFEQALAILRTVIVPEGVKIILNGEELPPREPLKSFSAFLETRILNGDGVLTRTSRRTTVRIFELLGGETATIYEKSIPVVETGDKWHVSVGQKVPTNKDRNNVPPALLHNIRMLVLNEMHDRLTKDDTAEPWIDDAGNDERVTPSAVKTIITNRIGENAVGVDPSDREAEKTAIMNGYVVAPPRVLPPILREKAKEEGILLPAGRVFPTYRPYDGGPGASPVEFIDEGKWSEGMRRIGDYAKFLAREILGIEMAVRILHPQCGNTASISACWCKGSSLPCEELHFNLIRLGHRWFEEGVREEVDELLIHELAHHLAADHLSEEFHEALCEIGAKMKNLALRQPEKFAQWAHECADAEAKINKSEQ